jgi:serine/threonine protein kinase/tetratricopeptide (TPR) repeat protein
MAQRSVLHYRLGERLGTGGMGEVYRADDTRLGRPVALKFLPASYQYDPERRARFLREARAASALSSPNIAAIYDIGEHEGSSFIVMEYVEGELLSAKLRRGPLAIPEALDIGTQLMDALEEAHSRGVIHRDIKSSNLIITERGLVKVLDFGLAKMTGPLSAGSDGDATVPLSQETSIGVVVGTVSYMSPEQALGRTIDHRADLFSAGVVMYEMLSARLPFEGDTPTAVIDLILHHEPPALARLNYSVSPRLEQIVRKSLEKDPRFRYQTAREFYIDLHTLRRDLESVSRSGSQTLSEHLPTAPLGGEGAKSGPIAHAKLANPVAVMTFSNITREPGDNWIGSGIAETVTADLKNIHGLSVIGRERIFEVQRSFGSSVMEELDEKLAIDIGRRLDVRWLVGGGFQRVGDLIRITARVVDVQTGAIVRTVKIDGKVAELFDLQDRIVYELSQGLNLKLGHSEITAIERDETQSMEAYEDFTRGMLNLRMSTRESLDRAIFLFEKAIEHDPGYASAWAARGAAYNLKGGFLGLKELSEKGIEFQLKAIALNPRLSQAYMGLGGAYINVGRVDDAIQAIKEAVRLDSNSAGAYSMLGRAYWLGKGMVTEAIEALERAVVLNPESGYAFLQLCFLYVISGDYDRAERTAKQAVALQERHISGTEGLQVIGAHTRLGYVYYRQGRYDEAIEEYKSELDFLGASDHALRDRGLIELHQKLFAAYLRNGMEEEAARHSRVAIDMYDERVSRGAADPFTTYYVANLYALMGQADKAIKYLEETMSKLREFTTLRARTDPDFENIRDHPRFQQLVSTATLQAG